jgi:predicted nucleotidyltransferase
MDAVKDIIPGLSEKDTRIILQTIEKFPEIEQAVLFGSRAKGNYKKGSDVDIVLRGYEITPHIVSRIKYILNEEVPLPWFFDVLHYDNLKNEELKEHIDRVGMVFYIKRPIG